MLDCDGYTSFEDLADLNAHGECDAEKLKKIAELLEEASRLTGGLSHSDADDLREAIDYAVEDAVRYGGHAKKAAMADDYDARREHSTHYRAAHF